MVAHLPEAPRLHKGVVQLPTAGELENKVDPLVVVEEAKPADGTGRNGTDPANKAAPINEIRTKTPNNGPTLLRDNRQRASQHHSGYTNAHPRRIPPDKTITSII